MRTTTLAVSIIVAMAFPLFSALGQNPEGDLVLGTASEPFSLVHAAQRPNVRLTPTFDAAFLRGLGISERRASEETRNDNFKTRFSLGVLGFVSGALIGYESGAMIHSCETCYFGASTEMITGTIAGALIGTSLLAIPRLGSACTLGARIRRAFAGAGIGYLAGLVLLSGPIFPRPSPFASPGVALATAFGGSLLQGRCS